MPEVRRRMTKSQLEFIAAKERCVLNSGGLGTGKTDALCCVVAMRAGRPGAREGLCRKTLVSLKSSTLKTMLEGDGSRPPVLPPGSYIHNKVDKCIKIKGGGEILYFGLDDPSNLGSYNLTGCGVDEGSQLNETDFNWVNGRCRVPLDGLPNQVFIGTNPGPPTHWMVERWGLTGSKDARPGYRAIRSKLEDNPGLPPDYVESVKALTGVARKRFYLGEWAGSDGLVFDNWNPEIHMRSRPGPWSRHVLGIDDGHTNPFVCMSIRVDGDGRCHVDACHYEAKLQRPAKLEIIRRMWEDGITEAVVVDPSAAELIAAIRDMGLHVVAADNERKQGCERVRARLVVAGDGYPRLTVDPSLKAVIQEFETYEYRPGTDDPKKEMDHAADACRYGLAFIDGPTPTAMFAGGSGGSVNANTFVFEPVSLDWNEKRKDIHWGFEE